MSSQKRRPSSVAEENFFNGMYTNFETLVTGLMADFRTAATASPETIQRLRTRATIARATVRPYTGAAYISSGRKGFDEK